MIGKQTINYSVKLRDIRQDDEYLKAHNEAKEVIDRIMLILKAVLSFLSTPLMEYQAKVPMIKPPITKTNVLKMNNNFKGAVALYDYIISYDKQGYTIENQVTTVAPFSSEMAEEFAQAGGMLTFLSYEYGLGLKQDLKFSYEREEERRKDALVQKVKDQVASLNKRLQKAEISPEEYILKLEEQIKILEKQCERMEMLRKEVDRLKVNENKLLADMKIAYLDISKLKSEILAKEYEKIQALDEAQRECSQKMAALTDALNAEKLEATAKLIEEINQLQGKIGNLIEINRSESDEMQKTLNMKTEEYNTLMFEFEKTREEKRFAEARLKSYRFKNHDMTDTDDYTDKDSFDELENELEVFIKFYKKEWTRTKRRIRKDLLNIKNIRKQNEHE